MRTIRAAAALAAACHLAFAASPAGAYQLLGADWTYKSDPMGEPWQICIAGMPPGAQQIIRRAATVWNYRRFRFSFRSNGCSQVDYDRPSGVNRIDEGGLSGGRTLAETNVFYIPSEGEIVECHLRFNDRDAVVRGPGPGAARPLRPVLRGAPRVRPLPRARAQPRPPDPGHVPDDRRRAWPGAASSPTTSRASARSTGGRVPVSRTGRSVGPGRRGRGGPDGTEGPPGPALPGEGAPLAPCPWRRAARALA